MARTMKSYEPLVTWTSLHYTYSIKVIGIISSVEHSETFIDYASIIFGTIEVGKHKA